MEIAFDIKNITDEQKYNLLWTINQEKLKFEEYLYTNHLEPIFDPFEYKIIIKDKIFGFITDGFMCQDTKQIVFYGTDDIKIITHEWAHAAFPNVECERHSEGLATYIQMQIGTFHFKGFEKPLDLVRSYMYSYNKENISDWLEYIRNNQNFYDSRWGRMLMSRALSAEFVRFLIEKKGLHGYFSDFYSKIRTNKDTNWREELEFVSFLESLPKSSPTSMVPFLELKASFIESYSNHFIPKTGSVLNYLINNKNKIEPKEYNFLQDVALEDLRTTLQFYA